ncbi:hypothetical protein C8D89_1259 [Actinomycetospora cinnamomea]|uniref:Uncharacterized protein n=1 Tax=Actinomycetospora cinnamomea TaxID=663609 RepID=A0A2U1EBJ5_9PSEU|nr:hypothetical protein C8D89_1259 [Actinomycetospora cinnamomea]
MPTRKKLLADPVQTAMPLAIATPSTPPIAVDRASPRTRRTTVNPTATTAETPAVVSSGRWGDRPANTSWGTVVPTTPNGPPIWSTSDAGRAVVSGAFPAVTAGRASVAISSSCSVPAGRPVGSGIVSVLSSERDRWARRAGPGHGVP